MSFIKSRNSVVELRFLINKDISISAMAKRELGASVCRRCRQENLELSLKLISSTAQVSSAPPPAHKPRAHTLRQSAAVDRDGDLGRYLDLLRI